MDGDRKYRQSGYMDSDRGVLAGRKDEKPKGPRPSIDITGPRLPRLVQNVVAARCYSCSVQLPAGTDFKGTCFKCGASLHCCKQCAHFEPSTRFQCSKAVPVRIVLKDQANECTLFSARVTVARDAASSGSPVTATAPRNSTDARAAFDSLFKKE
jgi:hypothetical protein